MNVDWPLLPGVYKDDTALAAEGYITDANNMRCVKNGDLPPEWEVMRGYEAVTQDTFTGIARGGSVWSDLGGTPAVAWATEGAFYTYYRGELLNITPLKLKSARANPFTTESGSAVVKVAFPAHGLIADDAVTVSFADAVGGITVDGAYTVTEVITPDIFTITHSGNASSDATGGGYVHFEATYDIGLTDGLGGDGYGTGDFGTGTYGTSSPSASFLPRTTSVSNWGQNGLFIPFMGAVYEWQPLPSYVDVLEVGDFASSDGWTTGTGWSIGSGVATASAGTASSLKYDLTGAISGGVFYTMTYTATVSAGECVFRIYSEDTEIWTQYGEPIDKDGTYTLRFQAPASPSEISFDKDASFAGTIDNITIQPESSAYRLMDAPQTSIGGFVDPNRHVVLYGTVEYAGYFNALHVRWSDQENNRNWIPSTDSLAGGITLAAGSRCVGGLATSNENLIWTDAALYYMRYSGNSDVYRIDHAGSGCGLIGQRAAVELNGTAFWASNSRNFFIYDGGVPRALMCSLNDDFFDNIATAQEEKIYAGVIPEAFEIWWFYPDKRDGTNEISRAIVYNWSLNCWYSTNLARTTWINPGVYQYPIGLSADGELFFHEKGQSANGDALSWYIETGAFDVGEGDTLYMVKRFWPDFKGQIGTIRAILYGRDSARDDWRIEADKNISTNTEKLDFRARARQMKIRLSGSQAPAGARFGKFRADVYPSGARR